MWIGHRKEIRDTFGYSLHVPHILGLSIAFEKAHLFGVLRKRERKKKAIAAIGRETQTLEPTRRLWKDLLYTAHVTNTRR